MTSTVDWFVGSNGNLFGDCGGFRYCIYRQPLNGSRTRFVYGVSRDGIEIALVASAADAKLHVRRMCEETA